MPAIVAKVEGKGNGIKTVIVNMVDIARALNREAIYPTKYFGIELGAQTHIDATNERYIVNGSHDDDKLQGTWPQMLYPLGHKCYVYKNSHRPEVNSSIR
jgi:translation initiation factor 2 beta subunit (eIF-2beta)/eIF-5